MQIKRDFRGGVPDKRVEKGAAMKKRGHLKQGEEKCLTSAWGGEKKVKHQEVGGLWVDEAHI